MWSKLGGGLRGKRSNRYGHDKQDATLPRLVPDRIHNFFELILIFLQILEITLS